MVQRMTGVMSGLRAFTGGGCRALIDTINDGAFMQESSNATGMKGESWKSMESPQNYGFTSVVADAKKGKDGQIDESAEGFVSFMGGNRNFPVMSVMDDRRHRLFDLAKDAAKGAVAMFGLKEWGQQFLNSDDGMHLTGNNKKKIRISLVDNKNDKQQQQGQQQQADAGAGRGGGGAGGGTQKQEKGQKSLHKEKTEIQIEQNGQSTTSQHGQFYAAQRGGQDSSVYHQDRKHSAQATDGHVHIRFDGNRIWVDEDGHWSESPILQKKDKHCKE